MSISDVPSSPLRGDMSLEDQVAWYKSQYEQLETELAEFRVSSQELEAELEKDLEAAERRENALRSKADGLKYEVDEWKRKYKESKNEANAAQNTLEKEITTLRDTNRTLQHRLRDIEVANDDFERQARHTHSSLEDLEMKYNTAIEKAVMLEEEIKIGEHERENLRIESQRLRQELSDLKIEAEILQDKLKKQAPRHMSTVSTDLSVPGSPTFDSSVRSGASSPLIATPPESASLPPAKLLTSEPPSPPMSDASAPAVLPKARVPPIKTPVPGSKPRRSRLPSMDTSVTTRPRLSSTASSRPPTRSATNSTIRPLPATRSSTSRPPQSRNPSNKGLAQSSSLSHIRSLTAQMQRLEARVHSARSKLPAPATTPPRVSPRPSVVGSTNSFTARTRRRGAGSVSSVSTNATTPEEMTTLSLGLTRSSTTNNRHVPRLSNTGINRMVNGPLPNRGPTDSASEVSRPSSRASTSSWARPVSRADGRYDSLIAPPRPGSRAGGAAYTPLGRPISRASFSSSFHGHTMSFSTAEEEEPEERERIYTTPSKTPNRTPSRAPSRRNTYSRQETGTGIPVPSGIPIPGSRRTSIASVSTDTHLRRPSISTRLTKKPSIQFGDLGETY